MSAIRTGPHAHSCSPSLLAQVASMPRQELVDRLLHFHGKFDFDFTEAYLASRSTDQLRHILVAACKHATP